MNHRNRRYFHTLVFILGALLLILFGVIGGLGWAADLFSRWVYGPAISAASRLSQNAASILGGQTLLAEDGNLKLAAVSAENETLKKENKALIKALVLGGEYGRKVVPVSPAGFFREIGREVLMLNRGRESGINPGDTVMTEEKIYVGRVLRSGPERSDVILASSRSHITDVLFLASGLRARAKGEGGGELEIDLLPESAEIKRGDLFIVSPKAGDLSSGLLFGEIREASSIEGRIFKNARAVHLFNSFRHTPLFVITSPGNP